MTAPAWHEAKHWQIRPSGGRGALATKARVARSLPDRMVGLLSRASLGEGEALILLSCRSIHTWFMRFPIDAVFTDADWQVVHISERLGPWRVTPFIGRAQAVIELPAGAARRQGLAVGDRLLLAPAGSQNRLDTP